MIPQYLNWFLIHSFFSFKALEIIPNDPKALYRRCQAYENLGKVEDAYKDAAAIIKVDPKNTAVQPILKRLNPIIQEKVGIHVLDFFWSKIKAKYIWYSGNE